jgi:hypothetical protein
MGVVVTASGLSDTHVWFDSSEIVACRVIVFSLKQTATHALVLFSHIKGLQVP